MVRSRSVDINADVGEGLDDESLMPFLTSISVACGGHAGDGATMARALTVARRHGLRAGAHPSYPDRAGFGRVELDIRLDGLESSLLDQLGGLAAIARDEGLRLTHVKAHGALYNRACRDSAMAAVIARAAAAGAPGCALFCPGGSAQEEAARDFGLEVIREAFLDRGYRADGTLIPRGQQGDIITTTSGLARQLTALQGLEFETVCVHSDNPAAAELLQAVPELLRQRNLRISPYPIRS